MPDSKLIGITPVNDNKKVYLEMEIKFNSLRCNLYDSLTGSIIQ